jgi:hypothetical protein
MCCVKCCRKCPVLAAVTLQAVRLYEALSAARQKYYLRPKREAQGWKITPVTAAEQQARSG